MSSMIGETLKISVFGESHGNAIGVVMDPLPPGEQIDLVLLQEFLNRRAPGRDSLSTQRKEPDSLHILSGLKDGVTCASPLCAIIQNQDRLSQDYEGLRDTPRPSHADYPATVRYQGHQDVRGGGHFSGRLTAPICIAGGIAKQILARRGIYVGAHISSIGNVKDALFDPVHLNEQTLFAPLTRAIPLLNSDAILPMQEQITQARLQQDSIGGSIECAVIGLPAGIGNPMFSGLESRISAIVFGIPAIKGIEFGAGFQAASMRGSEHNDPYIVTEQGVRTRTNYHGGILGGISTGMPLVFRVAVKPTPSISREQDTISLERMEPHRLSIQGRHDPCIVIRAVPVIEAAAAIAILDAILTTKGEAL